VHVKSAVVMAPCQLQFMSMVHRPGDGSVKCISHVEAPCLIVYGSHRLAPSVLGSSLRAWRTRSARAVGVGVGSADSAMFVSHRKHIVVQEENLRSDDGSWDSKSTRPALLVGQSFLYVVAVASDPTSVSVDATSHRLNTAADDWAAAEPAKNKREVEERIVESA
jgi:hypothetical protein